MLPEISQQLLRKARAGQIYHSPVPATNGKEDKSKSGSKEADGVFVSKKWTLVARDQEAEEPTFLAKRRKGLPPTFGVGLSALVPQTSYRTTKVKKYDAEGKMHVYEVLAPEGQQVEGEIVAEDEAAKAVPVEPVAAAPGTIVEGVGVVNEQGIVVSNDLLQPTPPRRKPPPPRRKPKKGPGRGKKKVLFEGGDTTNNNGEAASGLLNVPGIATERAADSAAPSSQGDTPMPDAGDDDDGSGSEGEEGEDGEDGREEGELSPTPEPEKAGASISSERNTEATAAAPAQAVEVKEEHKEDDVMDTMEAEQAAEEVLDAAVADISALPPNPAPSPPAQKSPTLPTASSSSPELPLSNEVQIPGLPVVAQDKDQEDAIVDAKPEATGEPVSIAASVTATSTADVVDGTGGQEVADNDGDIDLLGSLEATLNHDNRHDEEKKEKKED
jgi:hypothetical protein